MELKIKETMNERGVTSAWLAEQVGISKVAVSNIVTGKSSPSLDNILKIADALNVSITELIGEEKLKELSTTNPSLALKNKRIDIVEPIPVELTLKEKIIMNFKKD